MAPFVRRVDRHGDAILLAGIGKARKGVAIARNARLACLEDDLTVRRMFSRSFQGAEKQLCRPGYAVGLGSFLLRCHSLWGPTYSPRHKSCFSSVIFFIVFEKLSVYLN